MLRSETGTCRLYMQPALSELSIATLDKSLIRVGLWNAHQTQPNYGFVLNLGPMNTDLVCFGTVDEPTKKDLVFASAICQTTNSNTITIVGGSMLRGNGACQ